MWVDNRRICFDGEKLWLTQDSEVLPSAVQSVALGASPRF
jgi:hypothetical protein